VGWVRSWVVVDVMGEGGGREEGRGGVDIFGMGFGAGLDGLFAHLRKF